MLAMPVWGDVLARPVERTRRIAFGLWSAVRIRTVWTHRDSRGFNKQRLS